MSHHRCRFGVLADHADAISTYTSGHAAATRGLALAVAAHGTQLPAERAATYERALHEFEWATWAAGRLARMLGDVGEPDCAASMATDAHVCAQWAAQARRARDEAARLPIGVIPT